VVLDHEAQVERGKERQREHEQVAPTQRVTRQPSSGVATC
jgi:hypothetical protein